MSSPISFGAATGSRYSNDPLKQEKSALWDYAVNQKHDFDLPIMVVENETLFEFASGGDGSISRDDASNRMGKVIEMLIDEANHIAAKKGIETNFSNEEKNEMYARIWTELDDGNGNITEKEFKERIIAPTIHDIFDTDKKPRKTRSKF